MPTFVGGKQVPKSVPGQAKPRFSFAGASLLILENSNARLVLCSRTHPTVFLLSSLRSGFALLEKLVERA